MWLHVLVLFSIHRAFAISSGSWLTALDTMTCNTTTATSTHKHSPMNVVNLLQLCMTESPHCDALYWDFYLAGYRSFDLIGTLECYGDFFAGYPQPLSRQGQAKLWIKHSLIQSRSFEYFIVLPGAGAVHGLTNRAALTMGIKPIAASLAAFVPYKNGVLGCHLQKGYCYHLDLTFESFSPGSHLNGRLATINGYPVVIGGYDSISSSKLTDSVQIYDHDEETWKEAPRMNKARGMFTCHNLDFESIVVIGGSSDDSLGLTDQVERWTFGQSSWMPLEPLPRAICSHQSVKTGLPDGRNGILVLGGQGGSPPSQALKKWAFFLDLQSMSWEDAPTQYLPTAMGSGLLHSFGNILYSIPLFQPTDDGTSFPGTVVLTKDMLISKSK